MPSNLNKSSAGIDLIQKDPMYFGLFIGEVVSVKDVTKNGKMIVYIPALGKKKSGKSSETINADGNKIKLAPGEFIVSWTSPFAGTTTPYTQKSDDTGKSGGVPTSYGMLFRPPDKGNSVLVSFLEGNVNQAFYISTVMPDNFNHMIPGITSSGLNVGGASFNLPVKEANKFSQTGFLRPIFHDAAKSFVRQGLINDTTGRGPNQTGFRSSEIIDVFGILTPGPVDPNQDKNPGGRLAGHSMVMDDNPDTRKMKFRTGAGHQIVMDDVNGFIHVINRDGTAWVELDARGGIKVFGEGGIDIRSKRDFNIRADGDINLDAGGDVRIKASGDMRGEKSVGGKGEGEGTKGTGGYLLLHAGESTHLYSDKNTFIQSAGGSTNINSANTFAINGKRFIGNFKATTPAPGDPDPLGGISLTATGPVNVSGGLGINIDSPAVTNLAGSLVLLNSTPPTGQTLGQLTNLIGAKPADLANKEALAGTSYTDQPNTEPEYDEDADNVLPTAGQRKKGQSIKSIVSGFVTAEPYGAHYVRPEEQDKSTFIENTEADSDPNSAPPLDSNSPAGYTKAEEVAQSDDLSQAEVRTRTELSKATDAREQKQAQDNAKAGKGALAKIGKFIGDGLEAISKFDPAAFKTLPFVGAGLASVNFFKALKFKFNIPKVDIFGEFLIGYEKKLDLIEFKTKQFYQDFNAAKAIITDAKSGVALMKSAADSAIAGIGSDLGLDSLRDIGDYNNLLNGATEQIGIDRARETFKNLEAAQKGIKNRKGSNVNNLDAAIKVAVALQQKGITVKPDYPGLILVDKRGNKIVDFRNGLGEEGADLTLQENLGVSQRVINQLVTADISEYQNIALVSFIDSIGATNFSKSGVLRELNNQNYARVPTMIMRWNKAGVSSTRNPVVRQDLIDRRRFEAELFTTPDIVKFDFIPSPRQELTYSELLDRLLEAKAVGLEKYRSDYLAGKFRNGPDPFTTKF